MSARLQCQTVRSTLPLSPSCNASGHCGIHTVLATPSPTAGTCLTMCAISGWGARWGGGVGETAYITELSRSVMSMPKGQAVQSMHVVTVRDK